jgi:two-component system sensor histidine kinase TorS
VNAAESGEQALIQVDRGGMSLVLLDISLPGIDGLTILKYIRTHSDAAIADVPVIAMSAHVFKEEVDQYLSAGMNGFLGKPFSLEDLEHAIAQAFSGEVVIANTIEVKDQSKLQQFDSTMIDGDISRLGMENVERLTDLFFRSADQLKVELFTAMRQGDFNNQEKLAHKLNGASANFGLERLCALLVRIEIEAKTCSPATDELLEQVETEFNESILVLAAHVADQRTRQSIKANQ